MSPRPQYSADEVAARRGAILEAALDQIAERGPEALRMRDVAEAAGVSVGTLQHYFASREDLLVQAFSTHSSSVVDSIAELSQAHGSAWEKLKSSLRAVPAIGNLRRRSQVWIELVAASSRNDFLHASVDGVFDNWSAHLRGIIDSGICDGSFCPQADPDLIVDTLVAVIDGFDVAVVAGRAPASVSVSFERIAESLEITAAALLGIAEGAGDRARVSSGDEIGDGARPV